MVSAVLESAKELKVVLGVVLLHEFNDLPLESAKELKEKHYGSHPLASPLVSRIRKGIESKGASAPHKRGSP